MHLVIKCTERWGVISTTEVTPEHFDKMFDINARGTFITVQKALPLNDGCSIILTGSGVWERHPELRG